MTGRPVRLSEVPETVAGRKQRPAALTGGGPLCEASGPDAATGCPGRLVSRDLEDGSALHPDYLSRRFRALVKKAGVPMIRLHDVHHTCATLLLAAGVPVKVVSERLGHSNPAFTMTVYQAVLPGMSRDAAQSVFGATKPARHLRVVEA